MNENAKKWLKALRSGKYKQIRGSLKNVEGFCSMGVAIDICPLKSVTHIGDDLYKWLGMHTDYSHKPLPEEIKGGFDQVKLWLTFGGHINHVALNDRIELTFDEIADFTEQNWDIFSLR